MLSHNGAHSTHELPGYSQQDYLAQQNLGQTANPTEYPKTMQQKKDYIAMISQELSVANHEPAEPNFATDSEVLHHNYQSEANAAH